MGGTAVGLVTREPLCERLRRGRQHAAVADVLPLGGGTLRGIGKPGEVVWSRVYIDEKGKLCMDLGRGGICGLPAEETQDRWEKTTPQWPIKHLVRYGITRNQFMARHRSNHETILYANSAEKANQALFAKAAMAEALGINVFICGSVDRKDSFEYLAGRR